MIKRILDKIKSLFKKKTIKPVDNNCPYKIERPTTESPVIEEKEIERENVLECEHCKRELTGTESDKDEEGSYYIWCNKCNYVNKINNGKVIRKENNAAEVMKAFKLFKQAGVTPSSYSMDKGSERHSFK